MENDRMYFGWVNFFFKGQLASSFHSWLCWRKRPWLCLEWGWPCSLPREPSLCPLIECIVDSWYKVRQSEFCQVTPVVHEVLQQQEWWLNRAVKFFQEFELGNSPQNQSVPWDASDEHRMNTEEQLERTAWSCLWWTVQRWRTTSGVSPPSAHMAFHSLLPDAPMMCLSSYCHRYASIISHWLRYAKECWFLENKKSQDCQSWLGITSSVLLKVWSKDPWNPPPFQCVGNRNRNWVSIWKL